MTVTREVELEGHIIDSGTMGAAFSIVMDMGGSFTVEAFDIGRRKEEPSYARLLVEADDPETLQSIVHELHQHGANPADPTDATLEPAPADRVVPHGFYSTTNHPTFVRHDDEWLPVENMEMDCAIVVEPADDDRLADGSDTGPRAYTKVLNAVEAGDRIVTGDSGIRVEPPERPRDAGGTFGFMQGGVSAERPSESTIRKIATAMRETNEAGGSVLAVCGPALIHSGAREDLARLVREGHVDMLSAGNGFAVHDIERDLYGTSLGVDTETLDHARHGHKHHIYAISEVIREGGIEAAVESGTIESGVMYECVVNDRPYVLAGSIRDDGPLPDTITDAVEAQNAIREQAHEADMVLMLSTLLHSVAVGNCLPSTTPVVCVDINPATVTQLLDRGSAQAVGMVTDVGTFVPLLAETLAEDA
ncbi:TIGR00300 family protein [Haloarcula onubensis]|uniref:Ornithine cyclodeaminase n=1 Tax=Haloarcula onubensis TaxID=2950539 RepID=A0ABU2FQL7_9EURY|nr:TIGR00300 family protein [Halomicroarcula sp. S3CR25-11]MDS0283050.1 TIGR00300 family protein [Halomicroarcula sp. S3CR25-11]